MTSSSSSDGKPANRQTNNSYDVNADKEYEDPLLPPKNAATPVAKKLGRPKSAAPDKSAQVDIQGDDEINYSQRVRDTGINTVMAQVE